jgi:hypothetical protein
MRDKIDFLRSKGRERTAKHLEAEAARQEEEVRTHYNRTDGTDVHGVC